MSVVKTVGYTKVQAFSTVRRGQIPDATINFSLLAFICWKCSTKDPSLPDISYLRLLDAVFILPLNFAVPPTIGVSPLLITVVADS
jgi:hypothetical protein